MRMVLLVLAGLIEASVSHAGAPAGGPNKLRELAVFPEVSVSFNTQFNFAGRQWWVGTKDALSADISHAQSEVTEHPGDIDRLLRFSYLLGYAGQTNEARAPAQKAEELCRGKQAEAAVLLQLGEALADLEKNAEAESVFRRAAAASSDDWRCWAGLGCFLEQESLERLQTNHSSAPAPSGAPNNRPSPVALEESEKLSDEAARCLARAVTLGTNDPDLWLAHASYQFTASWKNLYAHAHRDRLPDAASDNPMLVVIKSIAPDVRKAAMMRPRDYRLVFLSAYPDLAAIMGETVGRQHQDFTTILSSMPEDIRHSILNAMTRLEALSQDTDKSTAVGALESRAFLNVFMGGSEQARSDCRRALALDPTRDQAWDLLLGLSYDSASTDEMINLCRTRLKSKNSSRNHLLMAKLLAKQQKWGEAREESNAVLQLDPDNVAARIMLMALTIRQSTDDASLQPIGPLAEQVVLLQPKMPNNEEKFDRWREFMLDTAVALGLDGHEESWKSARQKIESYLRAHPDDETARQIRDSLP